MKLGTRISQLRGEKGLSQEALADLLNVSRQSVSKWETDRAVPELEKLVALSQVFGVTLDELVVGDERPEQPAAPEPAAGKAVSDRTLGRTLGGILLLCFGGLVILLMMLMGSGWSAVLFGVPFLVCGVLCLAVRRHLGLWLAWGICICGDLWVRFSMAITWRYVLLTPHYTYEMNYSRLAIGWILFLAMLGCTLATLWTFRGSKLPKTSHPNRLLGGMGLLLIGVTCLREVVRQRFFAWYLQLDWNAYPPESFLYVDRWGGMAADYLILALLILCLLWARRVWKERKGRGAAP